MRISPKPENESTENAAEQDGFAHASWLYGQWLAQEAKRVELPVLDAQPQQTILERLLSVAGTQ